MCSVVGYIGKSSCCSFILDGLARLEYRGYDSAGIACLELSHNKILFRKSAGQLSNLINCVKNNPIDGFVGIGHTRWSTHGTFSEENAHPHFDCSKSIAIVHNGIIENYLSLKSNLEKSGHIFYSETDTEVISHLLESLLSSCNIYQALCTLVSLLEGAYAFVGMFQKFPDMLVAVRKRSPLCIGLGTGEMFAASDSVAFAGKTNNVLFLPDESFAFVYKDKIELYDFTGKELQSTVQAIDFSFVNIEKDGYEHFMLKEIYEQKRAIINTVSSLKDIDSFLWERLGLSVEQVKNSKNIYLIACGTSWHSALIASFFFETITHLSVKVYLASEFRHITFSPMQDTLYLFISQSGETADTLEALRLINDYKMPTIALTNVVSSSMVREAKGFLLTKAGLEVAVASTKAFSTQLAALYWLAHRIAQEKNFISMPDMLQAENDLELAAHMLEKLLIDYSSVIESEIAQKYASYDKAIFLGRHISYPFAMESALKLKEIAYVFAQSYPSGELKHGPLALVDSSVVVYVFSHQDSVVYQKLVSNVHEVKARGGIIIAFVYKGQDELSALADTYFEIPNNIPVFLGPLVMTGLMQFFVYSIAKIRGCPIDKPRNLAKSVTVE